MATNELIYKKFFFCCLLLGVTLLLSSCTYKQKQYDYYSVKDNYVCATGKISYVKYNDKGDALYLAFSDLEPKFSDTNFKIVGDNLMIVQKNNIDNKLEVGKEVEFISATRYFGDGYVMPIVGITVDGEVLLEFDEGYENLIKWLSK